MKVKAFVAAAAALVAGSAFAQSSVTLYGLVDTGVRYTNNNVGGNLVEVHTGQLNGARWGLRGTEDLGGGLKGNFTLESGFSPDTGVGSADGLFNRLAIVGLQGDFGRVDIGRQYSLLFSTVGGFDALGWGNTGANAWHTALTGVRVNNSIAYKGSFSGVSVGALYGFGEAVGNNTANRTTELSAGYAMGPVSVGAAYGDVRDAASDKSTRLAAGGTFALGPAKLNAGYLQRKDNASDTKWTAIIAGANYAATPSLNLTLGGMYGTQQVASGTKAKRQTVYALADYLLSKRTDVYATVDYNKNKDAVGSGFAFASGKDSQTGVAVGVRHRF